MRREEKYITRSESVGPPAPPARGGPRAPSPRARAPRRCDRAAGRGRAGRSPRRSSRAARRGSRRRRNPPPRGPRPPGIGRGSCRGRGEILGGGGSLKKKKKYRRGVGGGGNSSEGITMEGTRVLKERIETDIRESWVRRTNRVT